MSIQTNSPSTNLGTSVSADGIRAVVTGTPGAGKPIVDDNAGGPEWGTPGGSPAIADITDWPSGLSATELGYVNGVTSAIQTQLDAKIVNSVLTTDGDLLTRTAGVPARIGLGSALQVLRTNAGATALEFADPSGGGFTPKYARFSRDSTSQSGISGSWAVDYLQYNTEDVDVDGIASVSGDDLTIAEAGTYLISQTQYDFTGGHFSLDVNGVNDDRLQLFIGNRTRLHWIVRTTGANQIVKFAVISLDALTMQYTDGTRPGKINFVEILRIS